jgi:DNA replication protein DnaC
MLSRYTFDNYETPDERRTLIKDTAKRFVNSDTGWFFIAGHSGSGKSHICTAICSAMIDKGNEVKYMLWRDENTALKSCITEYDEYQRRINKLKNVPVLYIDDFWKVRDGSLTNADVNLTFEIINARYNDITKRTIISTELMYSDIIRVDEAIGGRIFERSRGFSVKAPDENWRLRM